MKYIKRIICFVLCAFVGFAFVACGKKDEGSTENKKPTSTEMSIQEILLKAHKKLNEETNVKTDSDESFSSKENEDTYKFYDEFVYEGIYLLKVLSEINSISNNTWFYDDATKSQVSNGEANKLEMLYVNRKTQDFAHKVEIYILFSKFGYNFADFPKSYNMFYFEIEYNEKSKNLVVSFFLEKSNTSKNSSDSHANYYSFKYDSEINLLQAKKFLRLQEFDYQNKDLVPIYVNGYDFITFICSSNTAIIPNDLSTAREEVKTDVKETIIKFEGINSKMKELNLSKKKLSGLTDKLIKIANANKISDFAS